MLGGAPGQVYPFSLARLGCWHQAVVRLWRGLRPLAVGLKVGARVGWEAV